MAAAGVGGPGRGRRTIERGRARLGRESSGWGGLVNKRAIEFNLGGGIMRFSPSLEVEF